MQKCEKYHGAKLGYDSVLSNLSDYASDE
jgi:hypothetical protein